MCLVTVASAARNAGAVAAAPPGGTVSVQTPAGQPPAPPAGYAGSDTCALCHDDKVGSLKGTPHAQAKNPRSPEAAHGCESCHGPGQGHVDDDAKEHIRKFGKISAGEINETCLT